MVPVLAVLASALMMSRLVEASQPYDDHVSSSAQEEEGYFPQCSFLGQWNGKSCDCEPGWAPPNCAALKLKPPPKDAYFQGVHDADYPTFGGNVYKSDTTHCGGGEGEEGGDVKYYWIGQTQANRAGMSCWGHNSAGSIWESTSGTALGPYRFLSWVGFGNNSLGFASTEVPWLGNFRFTVETKLREGATSLHAPAARAVVMYAKAQKVKKTNKFVLASFGPPNPRQCSENLGLEHHVNPFGEGTKSGPNVQVTTVGYRLLPLAASAGRKRITLASLLRDDDGVQQDDNTAPPPTAASEQCELEWQIRKTLDQRVLVENINGQPGRDEYVNTMLTWKMIVAQMPPMPQSDNLPVNFSPLYSETSVSSLGLVFFNSTVHQWPGYTGMKRGMFYRPLFFRWNNPNKLFIYRERLGVMALRADVFVWDEDAPKYFVNQEVGQGYYEDPWAFETKHGFHIYVHEIEACKHDRAKLPSCGSSLHLARRDVDSLMFGNRWLDRTLVFADKIANLSVRTTVRQRPTILFENGRPAALFTGTLWPGYFTSNTNRWVSAQGAARCFAQEVNE